MMPCADVFDSVTSYKTFENVFTQMLDEHDPKKTIILRGNNQPRLTKDLRKAIMLRSKLRPIKLILRTWLVIENREI